MEIAAVQSGGQLSDLEQTLSEFLSKFVGGSWTTLFARERKRPQFDISWSCLQSEKEDAFAMRLLSSDGRPVFRPGLQDLLLALWLERSCSNFPPERSPMICDLPFPITGGRCWSFRLGVSGESRFGGGEGGFIELAASTQEQIASCLSSVGISASGRSELRMPPQVKGEVVIPLQCSPERFVQSRFVDLPWEGREMPAEIRFRENETVVSGLLSVNGSRVEFTCLGGAMSEHGGEMSEQREQQSEGDGLPLAVELGAIEVSAKTLASLRVNDVLHFEAGNPFSGVLRMGETAWASVEFDCSEQGCSLRIVELLQFS